MALAGVLVHVSGILNEKEFSNVDVSPGHEFDTGERPFENMRKSMINKLRPNLGYALE